MVVLVVVVIVVVVAVVACSWYGRHVAHGDVAPAFGVKRTGEGDYDDSPAYADGDDGRHRHRLDDVARCHVVACTLHRLSVQPLGTADVALRPRFRRGWRLPWLWATSDGGGR